MDNDILMDGIIEYTIDGLIKWRSYKETDFTSKHICTIPMTGIKKIYIEFFCNYRSKSFSMSITIRIEKNRLRSYKYISSHDVKYSRFVELSDEIIKKGKIIL